MCTLWLPWLFWLNVIFVYNKLDKIFKTIYFFYILKKKENYNTGVVESVELQSMRSSSGLDKTSCAAIIFFFNSIN